MVTMVIIMYSDSAENPPTELHFWLVACKALQSPAAFKKTQTTKEQISLEK